MAPPTSAPPHSQGWADGWHDPSPVRLPARWIHAGVLVAAVAYTAVFIASFLTQGFTIPHLLEPMAAGAAWLALLLFHRGRTTLAAAVVVTTVWVELTWSLHVSAIGPFTSLSVYVLLIVSSGLVLGGEAAVIVAGASWIFVPVAVVSSGRTGLGFGPSVGTSDAVLIWAIFLIQTGSAALLIRLALRSWIEAASVRDASQVRYARLFSNAEDGLVTLDQEGRIVASNPAASRLLDLPPENLAQKKLEELLLGLAADLPVVGEADPFLRDGSAVGLETTRGHRVFVEITSRRQSQDPTAVESLVVLRDVTPRVVAERREALLTERLRQAQRVETVGRLAGTVAHDFNNLLTAVNGCASLLSEHADPEVRTLAREIEHASDQGAALTRQLLAFSRRDRVSPEVQDISRIVREAEPLLRRLLGDRHQLVVETEEGALGLVDRGQVQQVLVNLVANARDAMTESGTVHLRVLVSGDSGAIGRQVLLEIEDSGSGMEPEVQDRLFEPFFTTKPHGRGTGLGLATVQGIVEGWNGAIGVDSAPGRGSIFRLAIPGTEPPEQSTPSAKPAVVALGRNETILVVEDEASVRRLVCRVLERAGFRTVTVERPEQAPLVAANQPIDLLLTDVQMPGLTGPQVRALVQERRPGLPVLFITGWIEPSQHAGLGADANVLLKPFHPDALVRRIRTLLDAARTDETGDSH